MKGKDSNEVTDINRTTRRAFVLKTAGLFLGGGGLAAFLAACGEDATVPPAPTAPVRTTTTVGGGNPATTPAGGPTRAPNGTTVANAPATNRPANATTQPVAIGSATDAAKAYLKAWEESRYEDMYSLLTPNAQAGIAKDKFTSRYPNIADEATLQAVVTQLGPGQPTGAAPLTTVPFTVTYKTGRVGEFTLPNQMQVRLVDNNRWLVEWTPTLIFPQLTGTNLVRLFTDNAPRGQIFDRHGKPMATEGKAYEIFVVPGKIADESQVLAVLNEVTKLDKDKIKALYAGGQPEWRMPIKRIPGDTSQALLDKLVGVKGIGLDEISQRNYPNNMVASHIVGYISAVTAEDLKRLRDKGYREDDIIGRDGVEEAAEDLLAGSKGGKLTIVTAEGQVVSSIKERAGTPSANVILALDMQIQQVAEDALGQRPGSVVILDANDGGVLGMASYPPYNPNDFVTGLTQAQFDALNNNPQRPFTNRPINGLFPVGSTFKLITAAAAIEKGGFTMNSRFTCTGHWTGLGEQYAKDCYIKTGHGTIDLFNAIVVSCDYCFYEIGKKLNEIDANLLPTYARNFGFGQSTNGVGLLDSAGIMPDPQWKQTKLGQGWVPGDGVNLAIGQGYLLASPLQLAAAYGSLATGKLMQPRLIDHHDVNNQSIPAAPKVVRELPINPGVLKQLQDALLGVTTRTGGTGLQAFAGSKVRVAGKTGTAESGQETPHAWFACYAPADKPKYAIVAMLENAGFGNQLAAPMARKVVDNLPF